MAMLGGGPRKRLTKRAIKDLKMRIRLTGKAREFPLKQAGIGKALFKAGSSMLRRFGKKIPVVKRFVPGSAQRIARAERLAGVRSLSGSGIKSSGKFTRPQLVRPRRGLAQRARPVVETGGKLIAGGAALELGSRALGAMLGSPTVTVVPGAGIEAVVNAGRSLMAHPGIGGSGSTGTSLTLGGTAPLGNTIVKVWDTGTARFARDASGMHYVLKKDGTIKRFRPPRPVCIPKKWDSRSMSRVMRRLASHQNNAIKLVQMMGGSASKTKVSRRQHSQTHP